MGVTIAIKRVSGPAHRLASLSYISEFWGQIEQSNLVFNNV
jgi:hypothetical protein